VTAIVFACVHNAGRSQIAAAFFNRLTDAAKARAQSAGTQPADRINSTVAEAMREIGIDLSTAVPQKLTDVIARRASLLITMGCGDECPHVPGLERDDWPVSDPKDLPLADVRVIRDEIRARVAALIASRGWSAETRP
jgi:arsenate reductase